MCVCVCGVDGRWGTCTVGTCVPCPRACRTPLSLCLCAFSLCVGYTPTHLFRPCVCRYKHLLSRPTILRELTAERETLLAQLTALLDSMDGEYVALHPTLHLLLSLTGMIIRPITPQSHTVTATMVLSFLKRRAPSCTPVHLSPVCARCARYESKLSSSGGAGRGRAGAATVAGRNVSNVVINIGWAQAVRSKVGGGRHFPWGG